MKVLVTGGVGYIGSFMTNHLLERGDEVIVVDSLERSNDKAINKKAEFVKGDLLNVEFVKDLVAKFKFDAVIHFAGYISMGESMENPYIYFKNNIFGALNLIEEMRKNNLNNFVFSSTAGVYGNPIKTPIPEDHPKNPTNPYGESKLMVEKILDWYQKTKGLNFAALRYFNASGASLNGDLGENHKPETHIIPKAIEAALENKEFSLFGTDYNTEDGTCVRDYIHVLDLVEAHVLAINKLKNGGGFIYNVGTGKGYSNKQVIEMVKKVSGIDFPVISKDRRPGDAGTLVADPTKIKTELGFEPKYSDLKTIVETAWKWHKNYQKTNSS